ncbi:hypothetical protein SAMN05443287_10466 [Micromonospora phaseoli]|uniref:Uncharacterized protein n=1 Tax=Micromonospora phaseoli TaxID=1144548 RepID=A0A1H6YH24_9ACTN|nr:hypothetical protein [Micromonospora phaseoli]PZW00039.1 hypothetical protein CLV64_10365 [Micromonospora phaseoli]GIJ80421.1 hypothetical protein Xph01_48530 [Micromonospora phaseoli]SEJ36520.1 hypothetical protein SAMN05443287_10466 [Micromonospora phaseoli]
MSDSASGSKYLDFLHVEGERLGWIFRDRNLYRHRFPEPYPTLEPVRDEVFFDAATASMDKWPRMRRWLKIGFGVALVLLCLGIFGQGPSDNLGVIILIGLAIAVGGAMLSRSKTRYLETGPERERERQLQHYEAECAWWEERREQFDAMERERVSGYLEWGAAMLPPTTRRVDIVGGSVWGWEALLTVTGASMLRTRGALTLVDFSGEAVCHELVWLARSVSVDVTAVRLPEQISETTLLSGMDGRGLVDSLVEAMHGDAPAGRRAERAQDDRILSTVCRALGEDVTIHRISAAVSVLLDEPGDFPELSEAEREHISDSLFSDEFRRQTHPNLRRIESHLYPLRELLTATDRREARRDLGQPGLTCLVYENAAHNAREELLKELVFQGLIQRLASPERFVGPLVIAGADDLSHRHIERLTDLCVRRGVRLVLMFRHLRDSAVRVVGADVVAFMRLSNHEEAARAADFIGRQHTFVLSQLTRTLGGSQTHSQGTSIGFSDQVSGGQWLRQVSLGRSWTHTRTVADSLNWNDSASEQRVYEYVVEPRTLQDLPDYALIEVTQGTGRLSVRSVECNPDIVSLSRVTTGALPDLPLPDPSEAAVQPGGEPDETPLIVPGQPGSPGRPRAASYDESEWAEEHYPEDWR